MPEFFLGIRLPRELEETVERYRRAFKAPRTVAHLTVIAPFTWEKNAEELEELLGETLKGVAPLEIRGSGLGSFGSRVLFVNVELTPELQELQRTLTYSLQEQGIAVDKRPYRPHITLAPRLRPQQFAEYREQLADFEPRYSFRCEKLSLFQFRPAWRWEERIQIPLGR